MSRSSRRAQPGVQLGRREHLAPRRRELDGEGKPIELGTDGLDQRLGRRVEPEAGTHRSGPGEEQGHGVVGTERRDGDLVLAAEVQAAGGS